ncbi:HAD hydrolase-like protein [Cellulomonas composti]|uniref:5'-nucleotidase n=1 Tax=Cellulomonas composti TaxID=266130 RepID=A0A511J8R9_9CELL|nr:HAD hydrolase-like protein [Cellulomonas composti]GEL94391.1 5'-nucleotidase [Cellulomonas composti]
MTPLVLLDLDGTLIDSSEGILGSLRAGFTAAGLRVPPPDVLRTFIGPPIHDSMRRAGVPEPLVETVVTGYRTEFAARGMYEAALYDGVREALGGLRSAGLRLAVATAKPEVFAVPICAHLGLTPLLEGIVGAPLEEGTTKGDIIRRAAADHPGAALMVGDREHDVEGAIENGLASIGVRWGFAGPGELEAAGATRIVESPGALVATVLELLGPVEPERPTA